MKTVPPKAFPSHAWEPLSWRYEAQSFLWGKARNTGHLLLCDRSHNWPQPRCWEYVTLQGFIKWSMIKWVTLHVSCLKIAFIFWKWANKQHSKSKMTTLSLSWECLLFMPVLGELQDFPRIKPITFSQSFLNGWSENHICREQFSHRYQAQTSQDHVD